MVPRRGIIPHHTFSLDILTALMDRGANLALVDARGWTPLMSQVLNSKESVHLVACLLQYPRIRATINVQTLRGYTALHWACFRSTDASATSIIRLLLQAGGNPAVTNNRRQTPLAFIRKDYPTHHATIAMLEQALDAEKTLLLVKARLTVAATAATASNTVAPSCLQGRVEGGQPLPRIAWRRSAPPRKATGSRADPKEFRNLMAFVLGMEGGPENTGMPRDRVSRGVHRPAHADLGPASAQLGWDRAAGSAGLRRSWDYKEEGRKSAVFT